MTLTGPQASSGSPPPAPGADAPGVAAAATPPGPVVAHCVTPYLNLTMTWVHGQVRSHRRYRPVVLTQAARNLDRFPVERLHDAAAWSLPRRLANYLVHRLTSQYPFYGRLLRQERAALIHAHFGQEGYRCLRARRQAGIPMVTTFYGLDASALMQVPVWRARFRRLFAAGDLFLAEGPHLAQRLIDAGCPADKVRVHKLGVDLDAIPFRPVRAPLDGHRVVLMCGYFREKKGFPIGVRAFARVAARRRDLWLHIIGDGPGRGEIEAAIAHSGVQDRVRLFGLLPAPDYLRQLLACHVLLHPSVTASDGDTEGGAPVTVIEALASGLPVVSSLHADIPVVAPHGTCALLAPERDVEALAAALDALLADDERRARMGTAGRQHVCEHHSLARQGERLEALYATLTGAGPDR